MAFRVGKSQFIGHKTYEVIAIFNNLSGVSENARIEIAGVRVGSVDEIKLNEDFQALVTLKLPYNLELDDDTIAAVKTSGLIGDRFIELLPGASGIRLEPGDQIFDTQSAMDLESLISKFGFGNIGSSAQ